MDVKKLKELVAAIPDEYNNLPIVIDGYDHSFDHVDFYFNKVQAGCTPQGELYDCDENELNFSTKSDKFVPVIHLLT